MEKTYTEKLARFILIALYLAIGFVLLWLFGNIVGYIVLSLVIALISKPVMGLLQKIKIKGKAIPNSILAAITVLVILSVFGGLISGLVPILSKVVTNIAALVSGESFDSVSKYLSGFNASLRDIFQLKPNFKIEDLALNKLTSSLNFNLFGNMIGSVASTFVSIGIGLFSVVFISFFLIKDNTLFSRIVSAITPDKHSINVQETITDVEHLLTRYFIGLIIDLTIVGLIVFIGLWAVARLDFETAIGIGFLAGLLNIIPYLGPWIGAFFGVLMGIIVKYFGTIPVGLDVNFWVFISIIVAVFLVAHLVDNFVLQPVIYSTSIKAHPLEIFIVLLIAGTIGGIIGMIAAIPAYTVVRVFIINFFPNSKFVKALL